jgi:hypothetical protein
MQHDDTLCKHDGAFAIEGGTKILMGFTTQLCFDSDVSITECQGVSRGGAAV